MAGKTSPHILSTSTNLLGFCLVVITSLHIAQKSQTTLVDEFTSLVALLLTFSSILSFISIRTNKPRIEKAFETIADLLFFTSLTGTAVIIIYITISFWNI
ncbi:hypothetical protein [Flavitalea sp.]|nr:hypothetical protein [Flavitalea sp.]